MKKHLLFLLFQLKASLRALPRIRPTFVFPYSNILQVMRVYDKIHILN